MCKSSMDTLVIYFGVVLQEKMLHTLDSLFKVTLLHVCRIVLLIFLKFLFLENKQPLKQFALNLAVDLYTSRFLVVMLDLTSFAH